jgi:glycine/D-amino acid oxidase-like deaminating enzyme
MTSKSLYAAPVASPVWAERPPLPLPTLRGEVSADVCVVGLGGSGLAAVEELLRLGKRVVGVDAAGVGAGAAGRNGGFLLAGVAAFYHDAVERFGRERARTLYRLTLGELDRVFAAVPDAARRTGSLRVADTPEEERDCAAQLDAMRADDLPVEEYAGPEGRGLLIPSDGVFQPAERCRIMAERGLAGGAALFVGSPVVELAGDRVECAEGRVRCDSVVVAVVGGLEQLIPELAGRVRTARLQMLATAPAPEVRFPRPVYARWGYEYWQQLADGRIALGGFRDQGGEAEWTADAEPSQRVQALLEAFLRERLGVRAEVTHRWAAPVGYSADGLPVLAEARPGVWAAGGYCGTGNLIGTLCGRAAAQLAVGGESELGDAFL